MPRFFTQNVNDSQGLIVGEDAEHISLSLRMRPGEKLVLCDGHAIDYHGVIETIERDRVTVRIENSEVSPSEPAVEITLFQALSKGDKMEQIIQKSVELGVSRIIPVLTSRCVSRPDEKSMSKKIIRYNKIALEAAKQCGRGKIPVVEPVRHLSKIPETFDEYDKILFFYEQSKTKMSSIDWSKLQKAALIVGAEGGFDPIEADNLICQGALSLSLGTRILRCETASLAALAALMFAVGEM